MKRFAPLLLGLFAIAATAQPTDLLISEYVEGSSNNKAVEFYNGTGTAIDLGAGTYTVQIFFNGNPSPGNTIVLTGTVMADSVFVLANTLADPAILAVADQTSGSLTFNGDDAVVLFQGTTVVDAIGQVGFDPGTEWGSGNTSTADNTIRREGMSCMADADPSDAFDPAVNYIGFPINTFGGLGNAMLDCGPGLPDVDLTGTANRDTLAANGGTLAFFLTATNNEATAQAVDVWLDVTGPVNQTTLFRSGTLGAGEVRSGRIGFYVSGHAPPGVYTLDFHIGDFATMTVYDTQTFIVTKAAALAGTPQAERAAAGDEFTVAYMEGDLFGAPNAQASAATSETGVTVAPNPFAGQARIVYTVDATADVRLAVYDVLGREIAVLVDASVQAGRHAATFDARGLAAGTYVYRLTVGGDVQTGRLTLAH